MILYMAQPRCHLNSQVLEIFFPSTPTPATLHYPEFTDTYSTQYGRLSFSLHFMTNNLFSTWPPPLPPPFSITRPVQSRRRHPPPPDPADRILVALPPPSLSQSTDLGCVGAQRIMFPGRFLV